MVVTEAGDTGLDHPFTLSIIGGGNTGGALAVDGSTGVVTLANPVDWETLSPNPLVVMVYTPFPCFVIGFVKKPFFQSCRLFQVMAVDQPDSAGTIQSSTATVYVTVTDVNEHTPSFTNPVGK